MFLDDRDKREAQSPNAELAAQLKDLQQKSLLTLEALRNVLMHNGGVADRQFIERMNPVKEFPSLSSLEEGDEVKVTGDLSVSLSNTAAKQCVLMLSMAEYVLGVLSE